MDKETRAADALTLLNNPVFRDALEAIDGHIYTKAISTKSTDAEACQDIVRTMQLRVGLEREIKRFIADGKIQSITDEKVRMFSKAKL